VKREFIDHECTVVTHIKQILYFVQDDNCNRVSSLSDQPRIFLAATLAESLYQDESLPHVPGAWRFPCWRCSCGERGAYAIRSYQRNDWL